MKCYNHPDIGAVIQCQGCSKGLCKECADTFEVPICSTCAQSIVNEEKINAKSRLSSIPWEQGKNIALIIWAIFFMGLGIWVGLNTGAKGDWWLNLMIYFAIGGLPWVIARALNKKPSTTGEIKKLRSQIASQQNDGTALMSIFFFFIKVFIGTALAAIATPFLTIYVIWELFQLQNEKAELKQKLQNFSE